MPLSQVTEKYHPRKKTHVFKDGDGLGNFFFIGSIQRCSLPSGYLFHVKWGFCLKLMLEIDNPKNNGYETASDPPRFSSG